MIKFLQSPLTQATLIIVLSDSHFKTHILTVDIIALGKRDRDLTPSSLPLCSMTRRVERPVLANERSEVSGSLTITGFCYFDKKQPTLLY